MCAKRYEVTVRRADGRQPRGGLHEGERSLQALIQKPDAGASFAWRSPIPNPESLLTKTILIPAFIHFSSCSRYYSKLALAVTWLFPTSLLS